MKQREVNDRTLAVIAAARENSAVRTPRDMMEFVQDGAADIATLSVLHEAINLNGNLQWKLWKGWRSLPIGIIHSSLPIEHRVTVLL